MASPTSRRRRRRLFLFAGAVTALAAVLVKRDEVAGLLGMGGPAEPQSAPFAPTPAPAPVSNYDAPGPVANTATPVPAPEGQTVTAVDEQAEVEAAAAEAANIGGPVSDYAGVALDEPATPEQRPLAEAGEGEAEGQEQTEAELVDAAEPTAPGVSDEQRQIEDAIEQAAQPEQVEPLASEPAPDAPAAGGAAGDDDESELGDDVRSQWRTWSGRSVNP